MSEEGSRYDEKLIEGLNFAVGDGYSQPCSVCLGILGNHETWCTNPFARRAPERTVDAGGLLRPGQVDDYEGEAGG